jgi:hypothetical protein
MPPKFMRPIEVWSKDASSYASFAIDFWPVLAPFAHRMLLFSRLTENILKRGDIPGPPSEDEVLAFLESAYPLDKWEWK